MQFAIIATAIIAGLATIATFVQLVILSRLGGGTIKATIWPKLSAAIGVVALFLNQYLTGFGGPR